MASRETEPLLRHQSTSINQLMDTNSLSNNGSSSYSNSVTITSDAHVKTKSYWYRWYILGLFSLVGALENIAWNTWGPIEASARAVYGWDKGTVSLLADWGAITFVLAVFPSAWLLDTKGKSNQTISNPIFDLLIHIPYSPLCVGGPFPCLDYFATSTSFPSSIHVTSTC